MFAALVAALVLAFSAVPTAALARAQFPVQSLGNRGLDVVALQHLLRHHGRSVEVSGFFGGETHDATRAYQVANGLKADGVARPATWQALVPRLQSGSSGEAVRALHKLLNGKSAAGLTVNGQFSGATESALQAFQQRVGLRASGIADETTWRHLAWYFVRPTLEGPLCGYEVYSERSAKWGTSAAVAQLTAAAQLYHQRTGKRIAVGDISLELGGPLSGHRTHRVGLDIDVHAARKDRHECRWGIAYTMRSYDRAATREMIKAIHEAAPGHVKLIYFNDPVLVSEGLVTRYPNHDAHLHVRFCEADHPNAAYRCPAAGTQSAAAVGDAVAALALPADDAGPTGSLAALLDALDSDHGRATRPPPPGHTVWPQ